MQNNQPIPEQDTYNENAVPPAPQTPERVNQRNLDGNSSQLPETRRQNAPRPGSISGEEDDAVNAATSNAPLK